MRSISIDRVRHYILREETRREGSIDVIYILVKKDGDKGGPSSEHAFVGNDIPRGRYRVNGHLYEY